MASPPEIGTLVHKVNHQWAVWLAKIIKSCFQISGGLTVLKACFACLKCLNRFLSLKEKVIRPSTGLLRITWKRPRNIVDTSSGYTAALGPGSTLKLGPIIWGPGSWGQLGAAEGSRTDDKLVICNFRASLLWPIITAGPFIDPNGLG